MITIEESPTKPWRLFEADVFTQDGERGYTQQRYVVAEDRDQAVSYFRIELANEFEDCKAEQHGTEMMYWDRDMETLTSLRSVHEIDRDLYTETINGKPARARFYIEIHTEDKLHESK